jgi:hypothetical protein
MRIRILAWPAVATSTLISAIACAPAAPPAQTPAPAMVRVDTVRVVDTVRARPAVPDTALQAGRFDNGKMWTFEYPPMGYFREAYGFAPDSAWFRTARLGALRLPNCTASFVSATGLVLTNHHCARESVVEVTKPGEKLQDDGFYAPTLADERAVEGLYADQLIAIRDITAELDTVPDAGREAATQAITERIAQESGGDSAGIVVEPVSLWNGARTSAYVFRRFTDLRLVLTPEIQIGFFGGDPDNFTYPRYDVDMSFFRVYVDGKPYQPDVFFPWSATGVTEGDPIFVIGNPGSTSRLQTVAQLEYRRDVGDKALLEFLTSRIAALKSFAAASPAQAESIDIRNRIFDLSNTQKLYDGMWHGLQDPMIMARRADAERKFQAAIDANPALKARYGDLIVRMAGVQQEKRKYAADVAALAAFGAPNWMGAALMRGLFAFQYLNAKKGGAAPQVLSQVLERFKGVGQEPAGLQERFVAARLADLQRAWSDTNAVVRQLLAGATPAARAHTIIAQSVLADSAGAVAALEAGTVADTDPAVVAAGVLLQRYFAYQGGFGRLNQEEATIALGLGRARYEVYGTSEPPDATFSLRVADGVVRGYEYNGTLAPAYTTFYGMYDRYRSFGAGSDWDLPVRWRKPPAAFDLGTPLDFVSTADIIGGNSGSPVLNRKLELVGLIFDGNVESLPGDYIYLPEKNRAVAVDARGIFEALQDMYGATRLVEELKAGVKK